MILGVATVFPWDKSIPTNFPEKIISKDKTTTIRRGKRWMQGRLIHFYTGTRTKQARHFAGGVCDYAQDIYISFSPKVSIRTSKDQKNFEFYDITIILHGNLLTYQEICLLSKNDGFESVTDFKRWFFLDFIKNGALEGQLIGFRAVQAC